MISNNITLLNNKEKLNKFFENATKDLPVNENSYIIDRDSNKINSVEKAINKYRNYSSVSLIKSRLKTTSSFSFNGISLSVIERELNLINPRKLLRQIVFLQNF